MSTARSLCDQCLACVRNLDVETQRQDEHDDGQKDLIEKPVLDHHHSGDSFEAAVQRPCLICNYLNSLWSPLSDLESFSTSYQLYQRSSSDILLHFYLQDKERVLVHFMVVDDETATTRHGEDLLAPNTSDDRVLEVARSWMKYCETNHPVCAKYYSSRVRYPSRLVDLLPEGRSDSTHWKLIEKPSDLEGGYASLSHHWGSGKLEPFKLTRDTHAGMLEGLPDSCLSGTYQDAMRVVRKLGLRYIWIDSLCISQDKGSLNIQEEAYRMADVYSRSSCNIAASTARQDTIFSSRNPLLCSPCTTMLPAALYGLHRSYTVLLSKLWEQLALNTPLAKRAWILQEQVLPSRVLYFGKDQLLWSCLEGAFCELYPLDDVTSDWLDGGMFEGDFGSVRQYVGYAGRQSIASGEGFDADDPDRFMSDMNWMDLLMLYGQRQLTGAEDKLLAIAGVTQLLSSSWNQTIIGGLIVEDLPEGLLWIMDHVQAKRDGGSIEPSPVLRAPSWTWAYYDGPVSYFGGSGLTGFASRRPVAKIINIDTDVTYINDIKLVQAGDLVLLCAFLPLHSQRLSRDHDPEQLHEPTYLYEASFPSAPSENQPSNETRGGLALLPNLFEEYDREQWEKGTGGRIIFDLPEYLDLDEPLTALFVTSSTSLVLKRQRNVHRFEGLVVRQHPSRGKNVWERVGAFVTTINAEKDKGRPPDTPMTQEWNLIDFTLEENKFGSHAEYDFDSAKFMKEFRIA